MLNAPAAANLLTIARETLLKSLLSVLAEDKGYPALMIANAMALPAREYAQRQPLYAAELAEFKAFYGESLGFNRRLARDARSGRFEGRDALRFRALLERQVRARLQVSNPKYLADAS